MLKVKTAHTMAAPVFPAGIRPYRAGDTEPLVVAYAAKLCPMVVVHHIQWLFVETENGGQLRALAPGQAPKAVFELGSEKPVAVYAYCNLHGLWMTKL